MKEPLTNMQYTLFNYGGADHNLARVKGTLKAITRWVNFRYCVR